MRATLSGYYRNLEMNQGKVAKELFDVTKQISSGQKIQYAHEDTSVFVDAVRLDNEVTTLTQVKQNADKALQFSTSTDTTMSDMTKIIEAMKVKLVSAATESHSNESLNALAWELRGLEENLVQLANTSINGRYLFSGSEVKTKPIDADGNYQGNAADIKTFLGSGVEQTYNINGADLFLGDENDTRRKITLNMPLLNQTKLYPDVMIDPDMPRSLNEEEFLTTTHTIRDLMGDTDNAIDTVTVQHNFYIQGRDHYGKGFKEVVSMRDDESIADLLSRIGDAFGNTPTNPLVSVTLNNNGQIEVEDNLNGSSKLDFSMVANTGAVVTDTNDLNINGTFVKSFMQSDYTEFTTQINQRQDLYDTDNFSLSGSFITQEGTPASTSTLLSSVVRADIVNPGSIVFGGTDSAGAAVVGSYNVTATSTMQDLLDAMDLAYDANVSGAAGGDLTFSVKDGKIVFSRANGFAAAIDVQLRANDDNAGAGNFVKGLPSDAAVAYDEAEFKKEGSALTSNISQVLKSDNSYADLQTKLLDVAGVTTLQGERLSFEGIRTDGTAFEAEIILDNGGSTFTVTGAPNNPYTIFNMGNVTPPAPVSAANPQAPVRADDMTYKQLTDVMNMIVTGNLPADNLVSAQGTADAYNNAIDLAENSAQTTLDSEGKLHFEQLNTTRTRASFFLSDVNASDFTQNGSFLSFQSNNALEISDPKTNFFKQIDEIISSVEAGRIRADGSSSSDPRNGGVQNAIQALDDISNHLFNQHSVAGVQSQTLQRTVDRTDLLIITTKTLRSETLDVDIAEASLELKQLELNYQAMLSSVSRISQLSLVNYL